MQPQINILTQNRLGTMASPIQGDDGGDGDDVEDDVWPHADSQSNCKTLSSA